MNTIKKIKIRCSEFPLKLGELNHSTQVFKLLSFVSLGLLGLAIAALVLLVTKEPTVITLNTEAVHLERTTLPRAEDQVREGIKRYLEKRYQWDSETVVNRLKESEEFIAQKAMGAFRLAVSNVARFSIDKVVSQKIYPSDIKIDLKNQTALITGDRVTSIQGLKAAGNLKLELTFESGPRTKLNPWGIYILKEREE